MHNAVCSFPGKKKTKSDTAITKTHFSFLFVLPNIDHLSFHGELARKVGLQLVSGAAAS